MFQVMFCSVVLYMTISIYYYADQCYHHFDDFISPRSNWFVGTVKKLFRQKDVNDLKAQSLMNHLHCYPASSPSTLRALLCQNVSAAVEDIMCKFIHVYDGYSCHYRGQPKTNQNSKVLSVRACLWYHIIMVSLCCSSQILLCLLFASFCRSSKIGWQLWFIVFIHWLGSHLLQQKQLNFS